MNNDLLQAYTHKVKQYQVEGEKLARKLAYSSILRLLFFLGFGWFVYQAFRTRFNGNDLLLSLVPAAGFIAAVLWAGHLRKTRAFLQQLLLINENEIGVMQGKPSVLQNGLATAPGKGFTKDLDIFGHHSLFHMLNRAGSESGISSLGKLLSAPFTDAATIRKYQACVKELAAKENFRQELLAHTLLLKEENTATELIQPLAETALDLLKSRFWTVLAFVWPLGGLALSIYGLYTGSYQFMLLYGVLGLLLLSLALKKTSALYQHISKRSYLFNQYAACFRMISATAMEQGLLKEKQEEIAAASGAFEKLSRLTGVFDLRLSLFSFFLNGLFMLDLLCARAYLRWNRQYQHRVETWFAAMGEIELLNSLATFHHNHPGFGFPEMATNGLHIQARGMGHPLMQESKAVLNDMAIGEGARLHLITGSNMSGKSTFLRSLGLNCILAQIGAPVFANAFSISPVRFLSSFHHIDSLEESTSYFYAELKCLQEIVQSLPGNIPALVLLDEVMRGTNSKDKHDGTAMLIKKIISQECLCLIATHDTELGILSETYPGVVENFCFESELTNEGLHFDFTMRKGVAQTKNATYLMQQMGII